jgi:hypothetical protein
MARTYRTLSLSLPPDVVEQLAALGKRNGCTGARAAAEIVLREIAAGRERRETPCAPSWCCASPVISIQGPLVITDEKYGMSHTWMPVTVLLCASCKKQLHGREYAGWIDDA